MGSRSRSPTPSVPTVGSTGHSMTLRSRSHTDTLVNTIDGIMNSDVDPASDNGPKSDFANEDMTEGSDNGSNPDQVLEPRFPQARTQAIRTPEPNSASPPGIIAKFTFTYSGQRYYLSLKRWILPDGSSAPTNGAYIEQISSELTSQSLNQEENHKRRLGHLRSLLGKPWHLVTARELEGSAFCAVLDHLDGETFAMLPEGKQSRMTLTAEQVAADLKVWKVKSNASEDMDVPPN